MWKVFVLILVTTVPDCKGQSDFASWLQKNVFEPFQLFQTKVEKLFNEFHPDKDWDCGSDFVPITRSAAKISVMLSCPKSKDLVNQACGAHDQCYSDQLGQEVCDSQVHIGCGATLQENYYRYINKTGFAKTLNRSILLKKNASHAISQQQLCVIL